MLDYLLICVGVLARFVDSIAGGGGLITVPIFSLILGTGSQMAIRNAGPVARFALLMVSSLLILRLITS